MEFVGVVWGREDGIWIRAKEVVRTVAVGF